MELKTHSVILQQSRLVLRPLTEDDWDILLGWNNDPEVLYYIEGDNITSYILGDMQQIYRSISQNAFCFIAEYGGVPMGECWLQRMNLERILGRYPGLDCRRIDLMIGDKALWGQGIGTEMIGLLTRFAFVQENADCVFGCDIGDYNPRSLKAFQKVGYTIDCQIPKPPGGKAQFCIDLKMTRQQFADRTYTSRAPNKLYALANSPSGR